MNTPAPLSMFIIGTIVFVLYIIGYVYMIYKAHNQQKKDLENDPELRSYYKSIIRINHNNLFFQSLFLRYIFLSLVLILL